MTNSKHFLNEIVDIINNIAKVPEDGLTNGSEDGPTIGSEDGMANEGTDESEIERSINNNEVSPYANIENDINDEDNELDPAQADKEYDINEVDSTRAVKKYDIHDVDSAKTDKEHDLNEEDIAKANMEFGTDDDSQNIPETDDINDFLEDTRSNVSEIFTDGIDDDNDSKKVTISETDLGKLFFVSIILFCYLNAGR